MSQTALETSRNITSMSWNDVQEIISDEIPDPQHQQFIYKWMANNFAVKRTAQECGLEYGEALQLKSSRPALIASQWMLSRSHVSADEVLNLLGQIANADISDYLILENGAWRLDIDKAVNHRNTGVIKKIKFASDGSVEIDLHDKMKALELLTKTHNLFAERHEVTLNFDTSELQSMPLSQLIELRDKINGS